LGFWLMQKYPKVASLLPFSHPNRNLFSLISGCGCARNEERVEAHAILFGLLWLITIYIIYSKTTSPANTSDNSTIVPEVSVSVSAQ